tara:strand:+ start:97 stop:228 length:132 start_codon:yes stop_codon:yes gene_type:complete
MVFGNDFDNLLLKNDFPDPDGPVIIIVIIVSLLYIYLGNSGSD